MTRVKRGVIAHKRRVKVLKAAKGFKWGQKSKERLARQALLHAGQNAFAGRKQKKRDYRRLWQTKIGAAIKQEGMSYSEFIHALKENRVELDRKILARLAESYPDAFARVVDATR